MSNVPAANDHAILQVPLKLCQKASLFSLPPDWFNPAIHRLPEWTSSSS